MQPRHKILLIVSAATFLASLDLFIVNIAFPEIEKDFEGSSVAGLSWVLNAYAIVFAALLVPAGRYADRVGRKRGFLTGLGLFALASAACGIAPSLETLIAARVFQAAGAALLMPTSLALLLPAFPPKERPTAIGVWAAVGGVAAAFGPPVGGLLVEANWRLVFLVNLPVAIAALAYGARLLVEASDPTHERPDLVGSVALTIAIAALALGFVEAPDWGWGDPRVVGAFAAAVLALALFVYRCATHASPIVDLALLRVRSFSMANTAQFLFMVSFGAMLLGNVLFMTSVWGYTILTAGLSLAPGPVMAAAFAVPAGKLGARVGQRWVAGAGCATFAVGCAWWAWQVDATSNYATGLLPGLLITGIGVGLTLANLASAATSSLPPARFATGSAVLAMARQIGAVVGVAVLIAVLGTPSPSDPLPAYDGAWTFMVIAALFGSAAAVGIGATQTAAVEQPKPALATSA